VGDDYTKKKEKKKDQGLSPRKYTGADMGIQDFNGVLI
jgi:hypothetical protein